MTLSSLTTTLQLIVVYPGVQQDMFFPFNQSVSSLRSSLHWWDSNMSCPKIASSVMPTISTPWTTGIPSNTKFICAIPATSSGVPPTPETFISVGLMGGRRCWGILWKAAFDITVTAAPVSIRKENNVPSTWPCVKISFLRILVLVTCKNSHQVYHHIHLCVLRKRSFLHGCL